MAIARTIASKSPLGLRLTKEALNAQAGALAVVVANGLGLTSPDQGDVFAD